MRSVEEITGERSVADAIVTQLHGDSRAAAIIGPEGCGKSSTAALIAEGLAETHRVVFRRGQTLLAQSSEAMLVETGHKASVDQIGSAVVDVAEDVAELIAKGHIPFARTLQRLFKLKKSFGKHRQFSERQQAFIFNLAAVRSRKSVVLIADNLHLWDPASLNFLAQINAGLWDGVYPNLRRVRMILVWTPEQARPDFDAEVTTLFGRDLAISHLARIQRNAFDDLLAALGAPRRLPSDVISQIYAISGGHLLFAAQVAALLQERVAEAPSLLVDHSDAMVALRETLDERIDSLGAASLVVRRLLLVISIVGDSIPPQYLACVLPDKRDNLALAIDHSRRLGLIEQLSGEIRLAHDVIRQVFLKFLTADRREWHARFAVCLAKLRPWDYAQRAVHHEAAGDTGDAEVLRVMALLQGVREMRVSADDDWATLALSSSPEVNRLLLTLRQAAAAEQERNYDLAISALDDDLVSGPPRLVAERDLILARLLLLKRTRPSYQRGLALIEDLPEYRDQEADLWIRSEELRLVLLAYLDRSDEARQSESVLRATLDARETYDPSSAHTINRLRRKAESIHPSRIAHDRLKKALAFFDPAGDGSSPRDVIEYVLTLNNLGANELFLGRFDSAFERLARCYGAVRASQQPLIKRVEIVLSNLVVAHCVKTGAVPDSIGVLEELTAGLDVLSSDGALVRANVGGLLALRGDLNGANSVLAGAVQQITDIADFSGYAMYFLVSNLAVVDLARGHRRTGHDWLRQADHTLDQLDSEFRPYATRRLSLLRQWCEDHDGLTALGKKFEEQGPQVGPGWRFHGRAIVMTDLQFWTEN